MSVSDIRTAAGKLEVMKNARKEYPKPPSHINVREGDWEFLNAIMEQKPVAEWDTKEVILAVQLARCQADIEREQKELDNEGRVMTDDRGKCYMNPRSTVLDVMLKQELAIMRSLRITGSSIGDARHSAGRKVAEQAARNVLENADDGLLAT